MQKKIQGIGMTSQRTRDRLIQRLRDEGIQNEQVLSVIASTPRHIFVDEAMAHKAYEDTALPIGYGQTISQPFIVARMTEVILENDLPENVLEVGTGSGYQSAILSRIIKKVYSVERIKGLLQKARECHRLLKLNNIYSRHSDGSWGWPEKGPYQAIIVTAAPASIPASLIEQLAVGGRMVIPVGSRSGEQHLKLLIKNQNNIEERILNSVRFVPLLDGAIN